jgi:hypothetical protein
MSIEYLRGMEPILHADVLARNSWHADARAKVCIHACKQRIDLGRFP